MSGQSREKSIEVYDEEFRRNSILTRSARIRKFKFYQYKPVKDSPSTPKTLSNWNHDTLHNIPTKSPTPSPILLPREDILRGKITTTAEHSKQISDLDNQIKELEKKIADLNNKCNHNNVDNLDEIFDLVNQKNDLIRRQMQLNILEQEKALEKANEELTKELRSLMLMDDSKKSKAQLERQQYLYEQSLALVNKRNELVHHMDVQERGIEEDNALKATLKNVISHNSIRNKKLTNSNQDQNCVIQ